MSDDKRIERIETKIDDIGERLGSIDITLAQQHESLKDHMRRTALLEAELHPVKKHVDMVEGAMKLITIIAAVFAIIETVKLLIK